MAAAGGFLRQHVICFNEVFERERGRAQGHLRRRFSRAFMPAGQVAAEVAEAAGVRCRNGAQNLKESEGDSSSQDHRISRCGRR